MDELVLKAINAALCSDWKRAVEINAQILKGNGADIDCLNRLGKAYLELGETKKAITFLRKVLKLDKYNAIAQKNLARASQNCGGPAKASSQAAPTNTNTVISFLEEPGKTKLISLVNLAPYNDILRQKQADTVNLVPKRHTVVVTDNGNNYLGALPDDVGHRLSTLLKGGNRYCALIKSVSKSTLVVFVRETCRTKRYADTPSFVSGTSDYFSYIRDEAITESPAETTDADTEDDAPTGAKLHADEEPEAT